MKYDNKKFKTIGLILEDAFTDYTKDITHSVAHFIMNRKDLRLVVVSGRQDNATDPEDMMHQYKTMYNSVYSLHKKCPFDGILISFPDMPGVSGKLFGDIPRVYIATENEDELTVNYDNESGIREALDYLVRIRGFTRICMLGGRDDNADAQKRKNAFCGYLKEAGLKYTEDQYEETDMSVNSYEEAARLLARNPDAQAIFCVNDTVAVGLYDAMRNRGLVPGRDIVVFGFDNSTRAGQMVPPLASIGTDSVTVGQKALEILLDKINGQEVHSEVVPTRLFGRGSFEYETYEITARDMLRVDNAYIYSFFDDCFYRYGNEVIDPADIDFRRLFYEILSGMMSSVKNRYMDEKQYVSIKRMIDIFFDNGAMRYTDANKFVRSISRLQTSMNDSLREMHAGSNNKLFSYMRNKAIQSQAYAKNMEMKNYNAGRNRNFDFMIRSVNYGTYGEDGLEKVIGNFDRMGFKNAALYLFDKPFEYMGGATDEIPEMINLRCVLKEGSLYVIPEERWKCPVKEIYDRTELPYEAAGYISFPLFYGRYLLGILVSEIHRSMMDTGEYLSFLIGRTIWDAVFRFDEDFASGLRQV